MRKTALVVGHTEDSPGACSPHNISCEWEFMLGVATELAVRRGRGEIFLYDTYKGGYNSMVGRNAEILNRERFDLILELHYNSAGPKAHGCEALYHHKQYEDWNELHLANRFCDNMAKLGFHNRGVKHISAGDRGYAAVYKPIGDTLILEPFFGSNKKDCELITERYWDFIDVIEDLILN